MDHFSRDDATASVDLGSFRPLGVGESPRTHVAMSDERLADAGTSGLHLSHAEFVAFFEGRLGTTEKEDAARHLDTCGRCREALREFQRALARGPRRRWGIWIPLATSAAAMLAFFVVPRMTRQITAPEELRAAPRVPEPVVAPQLHVVSPQDGARLPAGPIAFAWRGMGRGVTYHFMLSDASGATLWKADTPDTVVALPGSVTLAPKTDYFWFVDATLSNGRSTKTPAMRVGIASPTPVGRHR